MFIYLHGNNKVELENKVKQAKELFCAWEIVEIKEPRFNGYNDLGVEMWEVEMEVK